MPDSEDLYNRDTLDVITATKEWLEKAVIALDLCPFAKAVHLNNRIRYVVSAARDPEALLARLIDELQFLVSVDPGEIETTLLNMATLRLLGHEGWQRNAADSHELLTWRRARTARWPDCRDE